MPSPFKSLVVEFGGQCTSEMCWRSDDSKLLLSDRGDVLDAARFQRRADPRLRGGVVAVVNVAVRRASIAAPLATASAVTEAW